ncbi:MAG: DnaJ domain-containing protein [Caulobacterales bacterium]
MFSGPTPAEARRILGVSSLAGPDEIRRAFRAAAKRAHPDRPGGDVGRFREVMEAYEVLRAAPALPQPGPAAAVEPVCAAFIDVPVEAAICGGRVRADLSDGRVVETEVPAGLRHGERLSIEGETFAVRIAADGDILVRGSDLWINAEVAAFLLDEGGRAVVDTPLGRKVLWITREAAKRRLIRLEGQGLPARGRHPQGSLFVRLAPEDGLTESPARVQLRRFAAAWAA